MSGEKEFEAVIRIPGRKGRFQPDNDVTGNFWFLLILYKFKILQN